MQKTQENKIYKIFFDKDTVGKIQVSWESIFIEISDFIVKTVISELYPILDDIEDKDYDIIGRYFNLSKLVSNQSEKNTNNKSEKTSMIEANFHILISKVIEIICDTIH